MGPRTREGGRVAGMMGDGGGGGGGGVLVGGGRWALRIGWVQIGSWWVCGWGPGSDLLSCS